MNGENEARTDTDLIALTPIFLGDASISCPICAVPNRELHLGIAVDVDFEEEEPIWATGLIVFPGCGHLLTTCGCAAPLIAYISEQADIGEPLTIDDLYELEQVCAPEEADHDLDEDQTPGG